jgi:hypothetical protein
MKGTETMAEQLQAIRSREADLLQELRRQQQQQRRTAPRTTSASRGMFAASHPLRSSAPSPSDQNNSLDCDEEELLLFQQWWQERERARRARELIQGGSLVSGSLRVVSIDVDSGLYADANDGWERSFGRSRGEVVGRRCTAMTVVTASRNVHGLPSLPEEQHAYDIVREPSDPAMALFLRTTWDVLHQDDTGVHTAEVTYRIRLFSGRWVIVRSMIWMDGGRCSEGSARLRFYVAGPVLPQLNEPERIALLERDQQLAERDIAAWRSSALAQPHRRCAAGAARAEEQPKRSDDS